METEQHTAEKPMGDQSIKGRNQKVPRIQWRWKYNLRGSVGHSKGHAKMKVYSYKCLHQNTRDLSNGQLYQKTTRNHKLFQQSSRIHTNY
jgi:hypothetical protein